MVVVSDTSAITSLIQVSRERILADVFGVVVIPRAVEAELRVVHKQLPSFIEVREVIDSRAAAELLTEVNAGEAEAIVLAREINADVLLIDEHAGRALAMRRGLRIIGLVGVLIAAKKAELIPSLTDVLNELEQVAGFRLSTSLKAQALREAGELK